MTLLSPVAFVSLPRACRRAQHLHVWSIFFPLRGGSFRKYKMRRCTIGGKNHGGSTLAVVLLLRDMAAPATPRQAAREEGQKRVEGNRMTAERTVTGRLGAEGKINLHHGMLSWLATGDQLLP